MHHYVTVFCKATIHSDFQKPVHFLACLSEATIPFCLEQNGDDSDENEFLILSKWSYLLLPASTSSGIHGSAVPKSGALYPGQWRNHPLRLAVCGSNFGWMSLYSGSAATKKVTLHCWGKILWSLCPAVSYCVVSPFSAKMANWSSNLENKRINLENKNTIPEKSSKFQSWILNRGRPCYPFPQFQMLPLSIWWFPGLS